MHRNNAISVRGLSKSYRIPRHREKHSTLAEDLVYRMLHPASAFKNDSEAFYALNEIDFDIRQGDVVGIIGRNGAGKSTLLKILSRITRPSSGEIHLYGRVGSLLEVGTGFHPELTGRENIYLNGAILGMRRAEVRGQFDAIVDFSGVEQFLDTPVKRYSSGMYVRLAFAVSAHLQTEILIVDEVLAVGDAEFQRRCLGKMKDVGGSGRTVLFVSHHMQSVAVLCNKAMFLEEGRCIYLGEVTQAIERYTSGFKNSSAPKDMSRPRQGSGELRFVSVVPAKECFACAEPKEIRYSIQQMKPYGGTYFVSCTIQDPQGFIILHCDSRVLGRWFNATDFSKGRFCMTTPWLKPGMYRFSLYLCSEGGLIDHFEDACQIDVTPVLPYHGSIGMEAMGFGLVAPDFAFSDLPDVARSPESCTV